MFSQNSASDYLFIQNSEASLLNGQKFKNKEIFSTFLKLRPHVSLTVAHKGKFLLYIRIDPTA